MLKKVYVGLDKKFCMDFHFSVKVMLDCWKQRRKVCNCLKVCQPLISSISISLSGLACRTHHYPYHISAAKTKDPTDYLSENICFEALRVTRGRIFGHLPWWQSEDAVFCFRVVKGQKITQTTSKTQVSNLFASEPIQISRILFPLEKPNIQQAKQCCTGCFFVSLVCSRKLEIALLRVQYFRRWGVLSERTSPWHWEDLYLVIVIFSYICHWRQHCVQNFHRCGVGLKI